MRRTTLNYTLCCFIAYQSCGKLEVYLFVRAPHLRSISIAASATNSARASCVVNPTQLQLISPMRHVSEPSVSVSVMKSTVHRRGISAPPSASCTCDKEWNAIVKPCYIQSSAIKYVSKNESEDRVHIESCCGTPILSLRF